MAQATEAPATTTAEGPTSHTLFQPAQFTAPQLRLLHRGLDAKRICKDDKGFAHMQAWDIKRYLLRVFGFAGYDTENRELTLVREIETPNGNRSKWTVVYRAQVRLIVKDVHGRELGHWDGEAAGVGNNLPNLGDSHDMAMKSATSQALKRAATNLGDQFGLSLYNDGSPEPVVGFCMAHPPEQWQKAAEDVPEPNDPPVKAEQGSAEVPSEPVSSPSESPAEAAGAVPGPPSEHLAKLLRQVSDCWNSKNVLIFEQIKKDGEKHEVLEEEFPAKDRSLTTLRAVLDGRITELKAAQGGDTERNAA